MKKIVRSISGILPLTVVLKPQKCLHGKCIYCPSQEGVPESYTRTSAPILRAIACGYDPLKQVKARLKIYGLMKHPSDKIELIVLGGTFSDYPIDYQENFIKSCFDGLNICSLTNSKVAAKINNMSAGSSSCAKINDMSAGSSSCAKINDMSEAGKNNISAEQKGQSAQKLSKSLEEAQKINETAKNRCVGLCLETRPDRINAGEIDRFLKYGCTRVEIGVQTLDNEIYEKVNRGHTVEDVVKASELLKNYCLKVGYHIMLGLPGSNMEKDIENVKMIFNDSRFKPDQLKIYPTFVVRGTKLEEIFRREEYKPYTTSEIVELIVQIKKIVPKWVRIMRIMRDIPAEHIISECVYSHLRDEIQEKMKELGVKCNCIRCHEPGFFIRKGGEIDENSIKLKRTDYNASGGNEIFLSFEDMKNDILIGLLRLRIPSEFIRPEITDSTSLIREVHVFSKLVPIGAKPDKDSWQHRGYGTKLVKEAERIAKEEFGCKKMIVISGVGTREYFYKLGYKKDGAYVSKGL